MLAFGRGKRVKFDLPLPENENTPKSSLAQREWTFRVLEGDHLFVFILV